MENILTNGTALIDIGGELNSTAKSIALNTLDNSSALEFSKFNFDGGAINFELGLALNEKVLERVYTHLKQFASDPDFTDKMNLIFGNNWNCLEVRNIIQDWQKDNFDNLPDVDILTGMQLNGANAAFCGGTNTIYVSEDFLTRNASNPTVITNVLLEEVGHAIDFCINATDATGDEGDIFQRVVQGVELSSSDLLLLKTENDHSIILLNGETLEIEMSRIAVETFKDRLYQSIRGTDNVVYTRSSVDGENWTQWVGYGWTLGTPELEEFNGKLYQSVRGTDNVVYTRSTADGITWSEWVGYGLTWSTPELEEFNGRLYQSVRGTNQDGIGNVVYTRSTADGVTWSDWVGNSPTLGDRGLVYGGSELEEFNRKLYQSVRGTDNVVYTRSTADGITWSEWVGYGWTLSTPELEVFNGRLYQSIQGTNYAVYTRSTTDGISWSEWISDGFTRSTPTLTVFSNKLYQTVEGIDSPYSKIYSRYSTDLTATAWSPWREYGGATYTVYAPLI